MQDLDGSTFQNFKFLIQTRIPGFEEGKGERRRKGNGIKGKEGRGRSESSRKNMKEEEKGKGGRKGR